MHALCANTLPAPLLSDCLVWGLRACSHGHPCCQPLALQHTVQHRQSMTPPVSQGGLTQPWRLSTLKHPSPFTSPRSLPGIPEPVWNLEI